MTAKDFFKLLDIHREFISAQENLGLIGLSSDYIQLDYKTFIKIFPEPSHYELDMERHDEYYYLEGILDNTKFITLVKPEVYENDN